MTTLLASASATSATATEGDVKTYLTNLRDFIAAWLGTDTANNPAALAALGVPMNSSVAKTGAYTVVAADRGKVISCNGTFSVSVTAAATLGDGFVFCVLNTGSGTITVDPSLSELIDGATTKLVKAGKFALIYCDGTKLFTVGAMDTGTGSGLDADLLDGLHAAAFSLTSHTHASYVVGCSVADYSGGSGWSTGRILTFTRVDGSTFDVTAVVSAPPVSGGG